MRRLRILKFGANLMPLLGICAAYAMTSFWPVPAAFAFGIMILTLVPLIVWMTYERRVIRRAREHQYMLCTRCLHPLVSQGESGRCAECGRFFTPDRVQLAWELYAGRLKRTDSP